MGGWASWQLITTSVTVFFSPCSTGIAERSSGAASSELPGVSFLCTRQPTAPNTKSPISKTWFHRFRRRMMRRKIHGLLGLRDRPPNYMRQFGCVSGATSLGKIQIVRPSRSRAETQPQLHPALLRLSAMISQYFTTRSDSQSCVCINEELPVVLVRLLLDRFCVSCC